MISLPIGAAEKSIERQWQSHPARNLTGQRDDPGEKSRAPNCEFSAARTANKTNSLGQNKSGQAEKKRLTLRLIMNRSIFYIIGVIVVVVILLKLLGVF